MSHTKFIAALGVAAALAAAPSSVQAQGRARPGGPATVGRAAPVRGSSPVIVRPRTVAVGPYRPFYGSRLGVGFYFGYPAFYGAYYGYGYPYYSYYYPYGGYPYGYAAGPGYFGAPAYGGVRIDVPQKDAEVDADGYYAGTVNDFDGALQHLDLAPGPHHIEIRAQGFEPVVFDVNVQPGQTITYRADLRQPHH